MHYIHAYHVCWTRQIDSCCQLKSKTNTKKIINGSISYITLSNLQVASLLEMHKPNAEKAYTEPGVERSHYLVLQMNYDNV